MNFYDRIDVGVLRKTKSIFGNDVMFVLYAGKQRKRIRLPTKAAVERESKRIFDRQKIADQHVSISTVITWIASNVTTTSTSC